MKKTTQELLEILKSSSNIDDYIEKQQNNFIHVPLCEYLTHLLNEKSMSTGMLIQRSGLDRTYTYQILAGSKKPSRNKVLAICFSLELSFEETQMLLKATGYPILYARSERDSIIIFALHHNASITDVNELLYDFNYEILS